MAERDLSKLEIKGMNPPMRTDELLNFSRRASEAIRILDARTKKKATPSEVRTKAEDEPNTRPTPISILSGPGYRGPFKVVTNNGVLRVQNGAYSSDMTPEPAAGFIHHGNDFISCAADTVFMESGTISGKGYVYLIYELECQTVKNYQYLFSAQPPYSYEPESGKTAIPLAYIIGGGIYQVQYGNVQLFEDVYYGFFTVELYAGESNGTTRYLRVVDGADAAAEVAGHCYYNIKYVECPRKDSILPAAGYLCLSVTQTASGHTVDYVISASIADMPTLADATSDTTVLYPLAVIGGNATDGWTVRQISRYEIPHLFCYGPCDEEESSSSGTGGEA